MAESLLPFQCNHVDVEGLWKNTNTKKIQKLKREKVETDKRKRRRKRRKKKEEEGGGGETAAEDEAFTSTTSSAAPLPFVLLPTTRLGQIGLFFFFFFYSTLL